MFRLNRYGLRTLMTAVLVGQSVAFSLALEVQETPPIVESPAPGLQVGDKVPPFEASDETGQLWKSTDHVGKRRLVIYFYPADMTRGCTAQACGYRDLQEQFREHDAEVIGVSADSAKNHALFKKAHGLNFTLLADEEGTVAKAFGVPITPGAKEVPVEVEGVKDVLRRSHSTKRWTFVIGADGRVAARRTEVVAVDDPAAVLNLLAPAGPSTSEPGKSN